MVARDLDKELGGKKARPLPAQCTSAKINGTLHFWLLTAITLRATMAHHSVLFRDDPIRLPAQVLRTSSTERFYSAGLLRQYAVPCGFYSLK